MLVLDESAKQLERAAAASLKYPMKNPLNSDGSTRQKILDTALVLYAQNGIDGVPVRTLTSQAGVNVAAIHYHFGGAEALAEAVFSELSDRVNRRRVVQLNELLARAVGAKRAPDAAEIIEAFVEPYLGFDAETEGRLLAQLILKHRISPSDMTERVIKKHFDPMAKQFVSALCKAVPTVPVNIMYWRYMFMVSTVVLSMSDRTKSNRLRRLSGGKADASDSTSMRAALVDFIVAAIKGSHSSR